MQDRPKAAPQTPEEFSLLRYINTLLKRRWMIVGGVFFCSVLAAVYYKSQTPVYTAWARFMPSRAQNMSSRLDAVMGGGGRYDSFADEDTSLYYDQVLSSSAFLERVAKKKFPSRTPGMETDLVSYYQAEGDDDAEKLGEAIEMMSKHLDVSEPRQTQPYGRPLNIISISYSDHDPQIAAAVVNAILDETIAYNQDARNSQAKQNREFIESQLKDTLGQLKNAEAAQADFMAKNKKIVTPELDVERGRLERGVTVQTELYLTLRKQLELAKIEEQERMPGIEILDRAAVPAAKSAPKVRKNVMMVAFLSFCALCALAFLMEFLENINTEDQKTREFMEQLAGVKKDMAKIGRVFGLAKRKKSKEVNSRT